MRFVEEQAEVGEHHPQLLPAIAVLELSQQVPRELVLKDKWGEVGWERDRKWSETRIKDKLGSRDQQVHGIH